MQTFLPYAGFARAAAVLDPLRLGKQRVEVLQILRALHFDGYGWRSHPAVLMWLPTMLRRPVRWTGTRTPADLPFPAALQNPQPVSSA